MEDSLLNRSHKLFARRAEIDKELKGLFNESLRKITNPEIKTFFEDSMKLMNKGELDITQFNTKLREMSTKLK